MDTIDTLMQFDLTRQEAVIYLCLLGEGDLNGYELAKKTGISRSNTYTGLAGLVDKGAAWLIEGESLRYRAVPGAEFTGNRLKRLENLRGELLPALPRLRQPGGRYLTITGDRAITDKLLNLLADTRERAYLSMDDERLALALTGLRRLAAGDCALTIITDGSGCSRARQELPGATVHQGAPAPGQIRLISDSHQVLTGTVGLGKASSCLYSDHPDLVDLFKSSLKNEIRLASLEAAAQAPTKEQP